MITDWSLKKILITNVIILKVIIYIMFEANRQHIFTQWCL